MSIERRSIRTVTYVFKFWDPDGRVAKLCANGASIEGVLKELGDRLVETRVVQGNVFLNEGIEYIWKAVAGVSGLTPFDEANAHIGVGDGTTSEDPSQTGLTGSNKYYKKVDSGYPKIEGTKIVFRATFGPDEANFDWNEWTVANGPGDDYVNLNRKVESLGTKSQGTTWVLTVELSIS